MPKFITSQYLRNRKLCIPVSSEEIDGFNLFTVNMYLSMLNSMEPVVDKTNTKGFRLLDKETQCKAFTSLDGKNLIGKWCKSKKTQKKENINILKERICKVYDCSEHQAENYIEFDLIDAKKLNELYDRIFEPESLKISKTSKNKKK